MLSSIEDLIVLLSKDSDLLNVVNRSKVCCCIFTLQSRILWFLVFVIIKMSNKTTGILQISD